jgi:hypothetical protein
MQFSDLVDAAGGSHALLAILAVAAVGAVLVTLTSLAITVRAGTI